MIPYLLIAVAVVLLAVGVLPALLRDRRLDDVDRFKHARELTTSWARGDAAGGMTTAYPTEPATPTEPSTQPAAEGADAGAEEHTPAR